MWSTAAMTPESCLPAVVRALALSVRPSGQVATASVNVPPMSTATRTPGS